MKYAHIQPEDGKIIAWYDDTIHTTIPTQSVKVSDEIWQEAVCANANCYENEKFIVKDFRTQQELLSDTVKKFERLTTAYIDAKVQAYNEDTGLAFASIDAFPKYAVNSDSAHYEIANRFIKWAAKVWEALRAWQSTLVDIPTEDQWKEVVDAVAF
ncbi:MAG: hypothetical protein AB7D43_06075 [Sulfurimonadaceae bacterium]